MVFKDFVAAGRRPGRRAQARRHQHGAGHGAEELARHGRAAPATACPSARRRGRDPGRAGRGPDGRAALRVRGVRREPAGRPRQLHAEPGALGPVPGGRRGRGDRDRAHRLGRVRGRRARRAREAERGRPRRRQADGPRRRRVRVRLRVHADLLGRPPRRRDGPRGRRAVRARGLGLGLGELVEPDVDPRRHGAERRGARPAPAPVPGLLAGPRVPLPRQRAERARLRPAVRGADGDARPERAVAADGGRAGRALLRDEPVAGLAPAPPRRRRDGHGLPRRARRQQRLRRGVAGVRRRRGRLRARGPDGDDALPRARGRAARHLHAELGRPHDQGPEVRRRGGGRGRRRVQADGRLGRRRAARATRRARRAATRGASSSSASTATSAR